jgi:hypothetical protein
MKYIKPQLLNTVSAVAAIQGTGKDDPIRLDAAVMPTDSAAYESDE